MTYPHPLHRDEGDGPAVILFHGFPDTAATWDDIGDALVAAGHRVVVPHLRGYHPDTVDPSRGYSAGELGQDPLLVMDALGIDEAVLVGHDWGATLVYGAQSLAPERIRGIVTSAIPHPRSVKPTPDLAWKARHFVQFKLPFADKLFARNDFAGVDDLYARWAPGWSGPERDECVANVKAAFADPVVLGAAFDYYRALSPKPDSAVSKRVVPPALVVGGTRDLLPPAAFEAARSSHTGPVDVQIIDGAGHWPHREGEARFTELLLGFLAGLG